MSREHLYIDYNFIDLRGKDLRCLNNRFILAREVFRPLGRDVTN